MLSGTGGKSQRRVLVWCCAIVAVIAMASILLLVFDWPFREASVLEQLQQISSSHVEARSFRGTYFPHPGCVMEGVTFRLDPNSKTPPLISVEKLTVEGHIFGLFLKHVRLVRVEGLHITIPPRGSGANFETPERSSIVIDELIADGGLLEVARQDEKPPLKFAFEKFTMSGAGRKGPASYYAKFSNPEPPGAITTEGKFGPWKATDVGTTPVSGKYLFEGADLGVFHGIAGVLSSSGVFSGILQEIKVEGTTETPRFAVMSSAHTVNLKSQFHATVNAENGDTFLENVGATFLHTTMWAQGSVAGKQGQEGKTTTLEIATSSGRIEDMLLLFSKAPRAFMSGKASFHAKTVLPPGERAFLKKVELVGDFGIDAGKFTNTNTHQEINHLSEGARGEPARNDANKDEPDPETALSDLKGHVKVKDGVAHLTNIRFAVPGASAAMDGTYDLITQKIDLHGHLTTDSHPSNSTTGGKALLLKMLNRFIKKDAAGYVLPVKITGTYQHPLFGLDMSGKGNSKQDQKNWRKLQRKSPSQQ